MASNLRAMIFSAGAPDDPAGLDLGGPIASARGWVGAVASERGLRFLALPVPTYDQALQRVYREYPDVTVSSEDKFLIIVAAQVRAYLAGDLRKFSVELDLRGYTRFELAVWAAAARVPYGETRTYGWIAAQVGGGPGTAQAVGAALGNNPIPLIIPCHRIVGADGTLHGFGGGLDMKGRLLAMERGQATLGLDAAPVPETGTGSGKS